MKTRLYVSFIFYLQYMKTAKETFSGAESFEMWERKSSGLEKMVQDEIAQQVANALRNI